MSHICFSKGFLSISRDEARLILPLNIPSAGAMLDMYSSPRLLTWKDWLLLSDFSFVLFTGVSLVPFIGDVIYKGGNSSQTWLGISLSQDLWDSNRGQPSPTSQGLSFVVWFSWNDVNKYLLTSERHWIDDRLEQSRRIQFCRLMSFLSWLLMEAQVAHSSYVTEKPAVSMIPQLGLQAAWLVGELWTV